MSTTNSNETKATTTNPKDAASRDQKSELPTSIDGTDFPTPTSTDPGTADPAPSK